MAMAFPLSRGRHLAPVSASGSGGNNPNRGGGGGRMSKTEIQQVCKVYRRRHKRGCCPSQSATAFQQEQEATAVSTSTSAATAASSLS
jgi:hypothetical protein